jgi:DNA topoisomerase IB
LFISSKCRDLPGQPLFEYLNPAGEVVPIASEDVNDYLQQVSGQAFTAKDFRTWASDGSCSASAGTGPMLERRRRAERKA